MSEPYLSIVVASRNDDHGGDPLRRTQCFLNSLLDQCRQHSLSAELIVVEWNPPANRPRLAQALQWRESPCRVRIVEVPESLHRTYAHADALPLYQMIAKNVGIRRARGEFVLATNIDVLFSNELIEYAARRKFRKGEIYRLDRLDVDPCPPVDCPVAERLAFCASHVIRNNERAGAFPVNRDGTRIVEAEDIVDESTHLLRGWHGREFENGRPFRWASSRVEVAVPKDCAGTLVLELDLGSGTAWRAFDLSVEDGVTAHIERASIVRLPVASAGGCVVLHATGPEYTSHDDCRVLSYKVFQCRWERLAEPAAAVEPFGGRLLALHRGLTARSMILRNKLLAWERPTPHTFSCGDFTLMAREHWVELQGYAEFDRYSLHIDSLLCWAAHFLKLREVILEDPMRVYHIEHGAASGWTPEGEKGLFERLKQKGIPRLSFDELLASIDAMRKRGAPVLPNRGSWGLPTHRLRETTAPRDIMPNQTALLICDMWDRHWCPAAAARIDELAVRTERFAGIARASGVLIIHAPSGTCGYYADTPARKNMLAIPPAEPPVSLELTDPPLPIDDSDGGCDSEDEFEKDNAVWTRQHPAIAIADCDLISDDGREIYSALAARGITTLVVAGVHANMCILARSFGLWQMAKWGIPCLLVRDLTDAMYNPASRPFVSHARGTELVLEHIEKYWATTVLSTDLETAFLDR